MALLLLPAVSEWTAYRETIETLLPKLSAPGDRSVKQLDVAITLSLGLRHNVSRTQQYSWYQEVLRDVYSLICQCAARQKIDLDFPGGVDARVFFLNVNDDADAIQEPGKQYLCGPIVDLQTFVAAKRKYTVVYGVEGEKGDHVSRTLISNWRSKHGAAPELQRLPCGPSMRTSSITVADTSSSSTLHTSVAVGGTFDHIHIGHKLLLTATVFLSSPFETISSTGPPRPTHREIVIGITGDELLVNKKYANQVESWEDRQSNTSSFIESILIFHPNITPIRKVEQVDNPGTNGKFVKVTYGNDLVINYVRISDPFGPTITIENITALIISAETRAGGKAVNDKRLEKGWKELEVFEVDVLDAGVQGNGNDEDAKKDQSTFDSKISSTEIRRRLAGRANGHPMM